MSLSEHIYHSKALNSLQMEKQQLPASIPSSCRMVRTSPSSLPLSLPANSRIHSSTTPVLRPSLLINIFILSGFLGFSPDIRHPLQHTQSLLSNFFIYLLNLCHKLLHEIFSLIIT